LCIRSAPAVVHAFLGLGLEDHVPDAKTVAFYREGLAQAGAEEPLFCSLYFL